MQHGQHKQAAQSLTTASLELILSRRDKSN